MSDAMAEQERIAAGIVLLVIGQERGVAELVRVINRSANPIAELAALTAVCETPEEFALVRDAARQIVSGYQL